MADNSAIEWTDATWNPVTGCTKITRGCDNCYAARFAERWRGVPGHPYEQGFDLRTLAVAAGSTGALAQAPHDLRQFDERPVPQARAARVRRRRVRPDGDDRPPRLSGADQAELAHAGLPAPQISRRRGAGAYLVRRVGRGPGGRGQDQASASGAGHGSVFSPSSRSSVRWGRSTWKAYRGSSWAARAGRTRGNCASNGSATSATGAPRRVCRSSSSSGAGGRPKPAGASSKAWSITRCRVTRGTRAAMPFEWHPDGRPSRIGPRGGRKGVSVRRGVYSCTRSRGKHIFGRCSADLFLP